MALPRTESTEALIIRALDEFGQLKEYHKLLKIASNNVPEHSELLLQCYQTLAEPHLEELEEILCKLNHSRKASTMYQKSM